MINLVPDLWAVLSEWPKEWALMFYSPTTVGIFNDYEGHLGYKTASQHRGHIFCLFAVGLFYN